MLTIKNQNLKKQFEQFSKIGSEKDKKVFWGKFANEFDALDKTEQENMRQAWVGNMDNVDERLKKIGKKLEKEIGTIKVFPNDAKEAKLITELLSRMNVKYKVA